ncbi:MAG: hypothetical protein DME32_17585, partial [Verrucomicrobia bacterium]
REEIAITRNASESLETLLMGMDFKSGDEILTTTQDYPRMLTTLRQREKRENLKLNLIKIPIPPKNLSEISTAFEKGITDRTRLILISHRVQTRRSRVRLLRHQSAQMVVRAERHRHALRQARQDRKTLAAHGRRSQANIRHPQV